MERHLKEGQLQKRWREWFNRACLRAYNKQRFKMTFYGYNRGKLYAGHNAGGGVTFWTERALYPFSYTAREVEEHLIKNNIELSEIK